MGRGKGAPEDLPPSPSTAQQKLKQMPGTESPQSLRREGGPADTWISDFWPLCTISVPPTPAGRPGVPRARRTDYAHLTPRRLPVSPPRGRFPRWLLLPPESPEHLAGCGPACLLFTLKLRGGFLRRRAFCRHAGLSETLLHFRWRPLQPGVSRRGERRRQGSQPLVADSLQTGSSLGLTHLALSHLRLLRHLPWSGTHL